MRAHPNGPVPRAIALAIAVLASGAPLGARADDARPPNRIAVARPEAHASVGAHGDVGAGMRLGLPMLRAGLLESPIDELALSLGFDVQFVDFATGAQDQDDLLLVPQASVEWSFYPAGRASYFAELGFAVVIGDDDHFYHAPTLDRDVHTDLLLAGGFRVHSSSRLAFVGRFGWPVGAQLGVAF